MRSTKRRIACTVLAGALIVSACGCQAILGGVAIGAALTYAQGEGRKAYAASLDETRTAAVGALGDLYAPVLHNDRDRNSSRIEAVTSEGRDIVIILSRESETITMARVRVGVSGDEHMTRTIFDKIDDRLKLQ